MSYIGFNKVKLFNVLAVFAFIGLPIVSQGADLAGCGEALKKSLCYTDYVEHWVRTESKDFVAAVTKFQNRKCLPPPQASFKAIMDVYGVLPVEVQKGFCTMKRVFLVRGEVSYGALAEYYIEPSTIKTKVVAGELNDEVHVSMKPTGFILEISEKHRFLKEETASAYSSRVMQARFGQNVARDGLSPELLWATYPTPFGKKGSLATTIVHEVGHMLSKAHRLTTTLSPKIDTPWTKLSWDLYGNSHALRELDGPFESRISDNSLGKSDVQQVIKLFKDYGIPTMYAATDPDEEFAEQFLMYFYGQLKWNIGKQVVFDLEVEAQKNPAFKAKQEFIRKLLNSPNPFSLEKFGDLKGYLEF